MRISHQQVPHRWELPCQFLKSSRSLEGDEEHLFFATFSCEPLAVHEKIEVEITKVSGHGRFLYIVFIFYNAMMVWKCEGEGGRRGRRGEGGGGDRSVRVGSISAYRSMYIQKPDLSLPFFRGLRARGEEMPCI